jgi:hypothetical protein
MVMHMKKYAISLGLVALLVLAGVLISAGAAAPPVTKQLATPHLVSPKMGATLVYMMPTTFSWRSVSGAIGYTVEVQKVTSVVKNTPVYSPYATYSSTIPSTSLTFMNTGSFRWRVTALATDPALNSLPSMWRTFSVMPAM